MGTAQASLALYAQTLPPLLVSDWGAFLATARGDYATAEREFERRRREQETSPVGTMWNTTALAMLAEVRGKRAQAPQHPRAYMPPSHPAGGPGHYFGS